MTLNQQSEMRFRAEGDEFGSSVVIEYVLNW